MGWLGFAYREKGDTAEAIRYLEQSIALLTEFRYSRLVAWFKGWLSEAYLWAGDVDQASPWPIRPSGSRASCATSGGWRWPAAPWGGSPWRGAPWARLSATSGRRCAPRRDGRPLRRRLRGALARRGGRRGDLLAAEAHLGRCLAEFGDLRTLRYVDRALRLSRELGIAPATVAGG